MIFSIVFGPAFGAIKNLQVSGQKKRVFSYKEVCSVVSVHNGILITEPNHTSLDCTGRPVSITAFCKSQFPENEFLIRGYVQKPLKRVVCQFGRSLRVKISCSSSKGLCSHPNKSCTRYGLRVAPWFSVLSAAVNDQGGRKTLGCVYTNKDKYKVVNRVHQNPNSMLQVKKEKQDPLEKIEPPLF